MFLYKFPCGPLHTNAILFGNGYSAAVIDPSAGSTEKIVQRVLDKSLKIEKILLTHSHWDHIVDLQSLKEKTGAPVYVHRLDAMNVENPGSDDLPLPFSILPVHPDHLLQGEENLQVGDLNIQVMHTPGHSPGSVCFYLPEHNLLFSGDTLFCGCIGRVDLPTGCAREMNTSLRKLAELPPRTRVVPGHGADTEIGRENIKWYYV